MTKEEFLQIILDPQQGVPPAFRWSYPPGQPPEKVRVNLSPAGIRALRLARTIPTSRGRRAFTIAVCEATLNRPEVKDALTNPARFSETDRYNQSQVYEACLGAVRDAKRRYCSATPKAKRALVANARATCLRVRALLDRLRHGSRQRRAGCLFQAMLSAVRDAVDLPGMSDPLDNFGRSREVCHEVLRDSLFRWNERMSGEAWFDWTAASLLATEILDDVQMAFAGVGWESGRELTATAHLRTASVCGLASRALLTDDATLLPILADALQDAGLEHPPAYLRNGHVPSCRGLPIIEDLV